MAERVASFSPSVLNIAKHVIQNVPYDDDARGRAVKEVRFAALSNLPVPEDRVLDTTIGGNK